MKIYLYFRSCRIFSIYCQYSFDIVETVPLARIIPSTLSKPSHLQKSPLRHCRNRPACKNHSFDIVETVPLAKITPSTLSKLLWRSNVFFSRYQKSCPIYSTNDDIIACTATPQAFNMDKPLQVAGAA
jgi:hypothetical protein